jgi:hypothetical protein
LGTYSITIPGFCFSVEAQIKAVPSIPELADKGTALETIIVDSKYSNGSTTL